MNVPSNTTARSPKNRKASVEQEAVKLAESAGYLRVIANGVAMVTQAGREIAN